MTATPSKYGTGKEALLRAAVSVVAAKGLRGLTYRSVAEAAGVNNTLVAHHFGSRDALIAAALDWAAEQSISASRLREAATLGHSFTDSLLELLLAEPELQVFQYEMILEARRRPELSEAVTALYENYISALADGLGSDRQRGGCGPHTVCCPRRPRSPVPGRRRPGRHCCVPRGSPRCAPAPDAPRSAGLGNASAVLFAPAQQPFADRQDPRRLAEHA